MDINDKFTKIAAELVKFKYGDVIHDSQLFARYMRELGMNDTADYIDIYRDITPDLNDELPEIKYKDVFGSYKNCKNHLKKIDKPVNLDSLYIIDKALSGGKSGAFVFLVRDRKTNRKLVLKLYTLRLFTEIGDRDIREIFTACTLSSIRSFPSVYNFGIAELDRKSEFWKQFITDYQICFGKDDVINLKFYNNCYFLATSFADGTPIDKLNLLNCSPKDIISILHQFKEIFLEANKTIPGFVHNDLHPGNIIVDNLVNDNLISKNAIGQPIINIIDFDISLSPHFKKNIASMRENSGNTIIQEALLNTMSEYIGLKYSLYVIKKTLKLAYSVNPDFRLWYIYKMLFEIVIMYKAINPNDNMNYKDKTIPLEDLKYIMNAIGYKNTNDMQICSSFDRCNDLEYFNKLSELDQLEYKQYIKNSFTEIYQTGKDHHISSLRMDDMIMESAKKMLNGNINNKITEITGQNVNFSIDDYIGKVQHKITERPEYEKTQEVLHDALNEVKTNVKSKLQMGIEYRLGNRAKHLNKFFDLINSVIMTVDNFNDEYYNITKKHLSLNNIRIAINTKFDNYIFPIYGSDKTRYIKLDSKKEKIDGLNIYLSANDIVIKFDNINISTTDVSSIATKGSFISNLPFMNAIIDAVLNRVVSGTSEIKYDINKRTLVLDAKSSFSLSKIASEITKSKYGSEKITNTIKKLFCPSDFDILELITRENLIAIMPLVVHILNDLPESITVSIQEKPSGKLDREIFEKVVPIKVNKEVIHDLFEIIDNVMSKLVGTAIQKNSFLTQIFGNKNVQHEEFINNVQNEFNKEQEFLNKLSPVVKNDNHALESVEKLLEYNYSHYNFSKVTKNENIINLMKYIKAKLIGDINKTIINTYKNNGNISVIIDFYNVLDNIQNSKTANEVIEKYHNLRTTNNRFFWEMFENKLIINLSYYNSYKLCFDEYKAIYNATDLHIIQVWYNYFLLKLYTKILSEKDKTFVLSKEDDLKLEKIATRSDIYEKLNDKVAKLAKMMDEK